MESILCDVLYRPTSSQLAYLPEGPIQCGENQFSWVAIQHGADSTVGSLNLFDLATGENQSFSLPGRPGFALATNRPNAFVVGMERSLGVYDIGRHCWYELAGDVDADVEGTIINDGVALAAGLVFGTKCVAFKEKKAGLYLWRRDDAQLVRMRGDQICSNGKVVLHA